jgi:hypothetical protein
MRKIVPLAVILAATSVYAQQTPDVDGWRGAKWGMTEQQVSGVMPEVVQVQAELRKGLSYTAAGCETRQEIPLFQIQSTTFAVRFCFDRDGLAMVGLSPVGAKFASVVFTSLQQLLSEKYGLPTLDQKGFIRTIEWSRQSGVVGLTLVSMGSMGQDSMSLTYRRHARDKDKI